MSAPHFFNGSEDDYLMMGGGSDRTALQQLVSRLLFGPAGFSVPGGNQTAYDHSQAVQRARRFQEMQQNAWAQTQMFRTSAIGSIPGAGLMLGQLGGPNSLLAKLASPMLGGNPVLAQQTLFANLTGQTLDAFARSNTWRTTGVTPSAVRDMYAGLDRAFQDPIGYYSQAGASRANSTDLAASFRRATGSSLPNIALTDAAGNARDITEDYKRFSASASSTAAVSGFGKIRTASYMAVAQKAAHDDRDVGAAVSRERSKSQESTDMVSYNDLIAMGRYDKAQALKAAMGDRFDQNTRVDYLANTLDAFHTTKDEKIKEKIHNAYNADAQLTDTESRQLHTAYEQYVKMATPGKAASEEDFRNAMSRDSSVSAITAATHDGKLRRGLTPEEVTKLTASAQGTGPAADIARSILSQNATAFQINYDTTRGFRREDFTGAFASAANTRLMGPEANMDGATMEKFTKNSGKVLDALGGIFGRDKGGAALMGKLSELIGSGSINMLNDADASRMETTLTKIKSMAKVIGTSVESMMAVIQTVNDIADRNPALAGMSGEQRVNLAQSIQMESSVNATMLGGAEVRRRGGQTKMTADAAHFREKALTTDVNQRIQAAMGLLEGSPALQQELKDRINSGKFTGSSDDLNWLRGLVARNGQNLDMYTHNASALSDGAASAAYRDLDQDKLTRIAINSADGHRMGRIVNDKSIQAAVEKITQGPGSADEKTQQIKNLLRKSHGAAVAGLSAEGFNHTVTELMGHSTYGQAIRKQREQEVKDTTLITKEFNKFNGALQDPASSLMSTIAQGDGAGAQNALRMTLGLPKGPMSAGLVDFEKRVTDTRYSDVMKELDGAKTDEEKAAIYRDNGKLSYLLQRDDNDKLTEDELAQVRDFSNMDAAHRKEALDNDDTRARTALSVLNRRFGVSRANAVNSEGRGFNFIKNARTAALKDKASDLAAEEKLQQSPEARAALARLLASSGVDKFVTGTSVDAGSSKNVSEVLSGSRKIEEVSALIDKKQAELDQAKTEEERARIKKDIVATASLSGGGETAQKLLGLSKEEYKKVVDGQHTANTVQERSGIAKANGDTFDGLLKSLVSSLTSDGALPSAVGVLQKAISSLTTNKQS